MSAVQSDPKPPKASSVSLRDFGPPEISDKKRCKRAAKSCSSKASFQDFVLFLHLAQIYPNSQVRTKKRLVPWLYHHVSKKRYLVWGKSTSPMKVSRTLFFWGGQNQTVVLGQNWIHEFKWWCCLKVYWMPSSKGRSFLACRLNYICVHHTICSKSTQTPRISLSFIPNILYIYVYTWYMLRVYHQFQKHSTFRRGKSSSISSCHTNIWWVTCIVCI